MGVADKQTYKNQYHFTDDSKDTSKEHPSITQDPKINSTIKENPYRSNVEIEGDEIVLQPDMSALFKALGKKHSKGGMDVLLKPNAFVFSDYDELKISPKEHELFELKEGGTPAQTLKKNVNLKHYNTMVEILDNPFKDDLSKKSATKMLEKYISTLGNIAYIQEQKKGFPTGVPEFALGTAPVYDKDLKMNIDANKQYMKAGGPVNPKLQLGAQIGTGIVRQDRYIGQRPPYPDQWTNYMDKTQGKQYNAPNWINPNTFYSTPGLIDYMKTLDKQKGVDWDMNKADDAVWGWRHEAARQKFFPNGAPVNNTPDVTSQFKCPDGQYWNSIMGKCMPLTPPANKPFDKGPDVGQVNGVPQGSKVAGWEFTPFQKLSQLYNWGQYANVKRYMPYRSRYNATYVDPALVNPEQTIGDVKGVGNQQIQALNTLNPILRNAQAQANFGNVLGSIPGIRSQYDNQNAQIINQSRMYNNQVKNNESMVNMGNDQQYYQQAIAGRTNYDNMKQFLSNQAMNNTMRDVETNQKLAYNLLTQNNPAYNFNWETGYLDRTNKSILDSQSSQTNNVYDDIIKGIQSLPDSDPRKWDIYERLLRQKNILPYLQGQAPPMAKGGKMKKNPYK